MDDEQLIKKVLWDDHPNRCQYVIPTQGQCKNMSTIPGANCIAHGGRKTELAAEKKRINAYKLFTFKQRLESHTQFDEIKGLRDEIALLRMLVEEKLNLCDDLSDLVLVSSSVADLIMKINVTVMNCQKLEASLGKHIDASSLLEFSGNVVQVITKIFNRDDDQERIRLVADEIMDLLGAVNGPTDISS